MNSRERIIAALNHQPTDRLAIDFGGTVLSGAHVSVISQLREKLGLGSGPVKVSEPAQMLGEVDAELANAAMSDVVFLGAPTNVFAFEQTGWKPWTTFDGTDVLVPEKFNTEPADDGSILMYAGGDKSYPPSAKMPKGGFYFDAIIRQKPIVESELTAEDNLEEFAILDDETLGKWQKNADELYANTDKAISTGFPGTGFGDVFLVPAPFLKDPKGIRDIEEWYISTITRKYLIKEIFDRQAEIAAQNLKLLYQAVGENPNDHLTEVNVRQTIFYPRKPFTNYITVRGFKMRHAAPKWAPPTAEQMGLIGTHWSKGWIIENNIISHSINTGISLGKYGDEFDNAGPTAQAYLDSIDRARANGWNKETVGSHIIRNNEISWCEQAGIVGSMGASFSKITGNYIHDIFTQMRFTGAEMAGIKFHAPIDMLIKDNHIHDAFQGIWLDWMTQGTRVTGNLCYSNLSNDMFLEVNHGPFVIDNNLFLSRLVKHHSQGGAYAHNLFAGVFGACTDARHTPYFEAHNTVKVDDHVLNVGDDHLYNNIFNGNNGSHIDKGWWEGMKTHPSWSFGYGLWVYDKRPQAPKTAGNIYYDGAKPYKTEQAIVVKTKPDFKLEKVGDEVYLHITIDPQQQKAKTKLVTGKLLGKAQVPNLPFQNYDGSPLVIDTDYFGNKRDLNNPSAGPFENPGSGRVKLKVWPKNTKKKIENPQRAQKMKNNEHFTFTKTKALEIIKDGLTAGEGYGEVWIRDYNTFIELAAEVFEAEVLKENLLVFFKMQGDDGNIIDGFIPKDKAGAGGSYKHIYSELEPRYAGHKNTVETDQETSLVQAVYKYVQVTGDKEILNERVGDKTVGDRLEWTLDFLMNHRYNEKYGLIWGATTADWGDVQPEHHWGVFLTDDTHYALDIYDNAMFLIALDNFLEMVPAKKGKWQPIRNKIAKNVRKHLWDAANQKFIPHVYLDGSPFPEDFDESVIYYHGGTAVAIEANLLSKEEIKISLEKMIANVKACGAGSIGLTLYPTYPEGFYKNKSMYTHGYQNGGDWTWFGGRMIQQLIKNGFVEEAYEQMAPMVKRVKDNDGFFEWYSVDNKPKGSGTFRGSAGVLHKAIMMFEELERKK